MAKIAISLNEVLRNFLGQFVYTYDKYVGEINLKEGDVTNFNLIEFFNFKSVDELNKFLYLDAPLEVFGHADQLHDGIINKLNNFIMDINDDGYHTIEIVSREASTSIPATMFFLSKTACKAENIRFVKKYEDKWNGIDILITANPKALEAKPKNKISVKVNASYNKNVKADFEIDSLLDLIKNETLRETIFNTKTTTFEELQ